ncbi:hypothetical protein KSX_96800 [Ktedonospora formicarum]|uniref:Uncharacterized protein n=1 Tax=Ktedonospora formicarum TaxID=2778364 RepID=A0A8J3IEX2_9CHLR|nr:hypothetical protein KSX_96800 [Ktedonospora formicarum]
MHFKIVDIKGRNRLDSEHYASRRKVAYLKQTIEYVRLTKTLGGMALKRDKLARASGRINTLEHSRKEISVLSIDRPFFIGVALAGAK